MATSNRDSSRQRKRALVISNGDYMRTENRLSHSNESAKAISDSLTTIGFNVTTASNLKKVDMTTCIIDFSKTIAKGDLVLFYFSGHGRQVKGKNYLIPIGDKQIDGDRDVRDFAIDFERTLERLVETNPFSVNIFILDCSGTYLLNSRASSDSTAESGGLAEIKPMDGAFIQFACGANQSVRDNLFTKHLLKNITQPNVHITDVFRRILDDVSQDSGNQQRPLSINGIQQHRDVYLNQVVVPVPVPETPRLTTEQFLSAEPLSKDEEIFYEACKDYYRITQQPIISISEEVFDTNTSLTTSSIKFGIDQDCKQFDLQTFLEEFCKKVHLKINDIMVKQIQEGSTIVEAELFDKLESDDKKLHIKMVSESFTEKIQKYFGKMKIFFMFMGPIKSLLKRQKYRAEINLHPQHNRIYTPGRHFWEGPNKDGKDRGGKPYYCPVGWQRCSFYVTDDFNTKFKGWCICYHGTKFSYGLSILLSGLKPATTVAHGHGIYATPSINYACHPRYSEVKLIEESCRKKFFKSGKYVQFVLECRVLPHNIRKVERETLNASATTIDPNISNEIIEWIVDDQKKTIVDFNDPGSSIICTGLLIRVTDNHPALLPESQWWHESHMCDNPKCCFLAMDPDTLKKQRQMGVECHTIYD